MFLEPRYRKWSPPALIRIFAGLTALLTVSADLWAVDFENYTTSHGLVHKFVFNIIRDSEGFVWVATSNGLSRFDSYSFKNYTHNEADSNSLQGTAIYALAEGKNNKIWLSTDVGLECFDKKTERFTLIDDKLIHGNVFRKDMCVDEQGIVWMYNQKVKLVAYDPETKSMKHHITEVAAQDSSKELSIYHFIVDDGIVWMAGSDGISLYNHQTETYKVIDTTKILHCRSLRKAGESRVVVTNMYTGIFVINTAEQNGEWVKKSFIEAQIGSAVSLFDAMVDDDSTLWVSVAPGLVSIKNGEVVYYNYNSRQTYFDGNVVSCFYLDYENNLWLGSYEHGIFLKKKNNKVFSFSTRLYNGDIKKTFISNFNVFSDGSLLYADTKGVYYCPDYKNLKIDCAEKIRGSASPSLFPQDGRYCLVSMRDTLFIYDSQKRSLKRSHLVTAAACSFIAPDGTIWSGTWGGGLFGYDPKTKKEYSIKIDQEEKTYFPVFALVGGDDGSLWAGTSGAGVLHVRNPKSDSPIVEYYNKKGDREHYINSNTINCLYRDREGNIWIGTNGGGLVKRVKQSKELVPFTCANGLRSNVIEAITADEQGNIWFTSNVLSKYDIKTKTFTHFSHADGINGSFNAKAGGRSDEGDLLFASSDGIYMFNPNQISNKNEVHPPVLSSFRIEGITAKVGDTISGFVPYVESITNAGQINLPFSLNSFAIEFASINYHESEIIQYQYRLEGVDKHWIPSEAKNRLASYAGVQPGIYVFKVRAGFETEKWSEPAKVIINIIPPWWQESWFKTFISLFLTVGVSAVVFFRFRRMNRLNTRLEQKVRQRTNKLENANSLLQESHVVLEMKNTELKDALRLKGKLIDVLAHDFKNPLNGIFGIAKLLEIESDKHRISKISQYAHTILSSANSLIGQMMTVLDWAQSEDIEQEADPIEVNLEMLLDDAVSLMKSSAEQKEITIKTQNDCNRNALVDPRMGSLIFRNLLSNAIKYTPRGGSVTVVINEYEQSIDVSFIDNGVGMKAEFIEMLLESESIIESSRGTENETGTGLGLKLCKAFLEKNSGSLSITSAERQGSVFTVSLPKGEGKPAKTAKSIEAEIDEPVHKQPLQKKKYSVLVVDDDREIVQMVTDVLNPYYDVIHADNGRNGYNVANQVLPDVIVSDINMSEVSGIEMCRLLKNNKQTMHIPVLLISSNNRTEIKTEAFESGASDYIEKPFNPFFIHKKIEALLVLRQKIGEKTRSELAKEVYPDMPEAFSNDFIKKVQEFVEENIAAEKLNTGIVAEQLGASRTHLWRVFKNETGQSLGDYIKEKKIQKASALLLTGKYRISDIAFQVGFASPQYFSRWFTREMGISPTEYAQKKKTGN